MIIQVNPVIILEYLHTGNDSRSQNSNKLFD